jgi:hypothetical protein
MEKWVYNQCRFGLMAMAQTTNYVVSYDSGLVDIEKFVVRLLIFIEITKNRSRSFYQICLKVVS